MKQIVTTLCTVLALSLSSIAHAGTCRPLDVFGNNTNLSPEQRIQTVDLAEMYKEKYYLTKDFHRERLSMMVAYLEDRQNRRNVHETIARTHATKTTQDREMRQALFEMLTSLSQEQQAQISQNLSTQEVCFAEKMANKADTRPKIGEMLYQDLALTSGQRALLNEMYQDRQGITAPKQYGLHHEDLITWYLNDGSNRHNTEWLFAEQVANDEAFRNAQADAMMDLLDSFTAFQERQFIQNVQAVLAL